MATWLKQSTAAEVAIGPFVDSTDGFTAETALTISQADVRLKKNGGDWAQKNESTAAAHEENGWYRCLLDTTDTNTLGEMVLAVSESGALPVWREFQVVPANVWDSLFGADLLQVDTREVGGTTQTAGDIIADTNDIQLRLPSALTTGTADSGSTTTLVDAALTQSDTDYWARQWLRITSGNLAGQMRLITAFTPASDTLTVAPAFTQAVSTHTYEILPAASVDVHQWRQSNVPSPSAAGRPVVDVTHWSGSAVATPTVSGVPEVDITHFGGSAGTFSGGRPEVNASHISGDSTAADNAEAFFDGTGYAGTNNVIPTVTTVNGLAAGAITAAAIATDAIDADAIAADAVTEIQSGLSTLTAAGVRTAVGLASANLDTQLETIDNFLDTEVAAIKAKTDQLAFGATNTVNANITYVNEVEVDGAGSEADPWGPV